MCTDSGNAALVENSLVLLSGLAVETCGLNVVVSDLLQLHHGSLKILGSVVTNGVHLKSDGQSLCKLKHNIFLQNLKNT